jgi:hypothetical protein
MLVSLLERYLPDGYQLIAEFLLARQSKVFCGRDSSGWSRMPPERSSCGACAYDLQNCRTPDCEPVSGTRPVLPNGGAGEAYHEQGESQASAASRGWTPMPGPDGCLP